MMSTSDILDRAFDPLRCLNRGLFTFRDEWFDVEEWHDGACSTDLTLRG